MPRLDHLVVTAPDLASGVAYVSEAIGAALPGGGAHPLTATHNRLGATGGGTYFEVIAPNREAPPPQYVRPFGMKIGVATPRFATWVISVEDMDAAIAAADAHKIPVGPSTHLTRDRLEWQLTMPKDGALPLGGAAPAFIAWPDGVHPTQTLAPSGVTFESLEIRHPQGGALAAMFEDLGGLPNGVMVQTGADARRAVFRDATGTARHLTWGEPWT